jgi:hypothetical protein
MFEVTIIKASRVYVHLFPALFNKKKQETWPGQITAFLGSHSESMESTHHRFLFFNVFSFFSLGGPGRVAFFFVGPADRTQSAWRRKFLGWWFYYISEL